MTAKLWDLMGTEWRKPKEVELPLPKRSNDKLLDHMKSFKEVPVANPDYTEFDIDNLDSVSLQRFITKKKGSWFQVPKGLKNG